MKSHVKLIEDAHEIVRFRSSDLCKGKTASRLCGVELQFFFVNSRRIRRSFPPKMNLTALRAGNVGFKLRLFRFVAAIKTLCIQRNLDSNCFLLRALENPFILCAFVSLGGECATKESRKKKKENAVMKSRHITPNSAITMETTGYIK